VADASASSLRLAAEDDVQKLAGLNEIGLPTHSEMVYRTGLTQPTRSLSVEKRSGQQGQRRWPPQWSIESGRTGG
jgi:hypothetical protein